MKRFKEFEEFNESSIHGTGITTASVMINKTYRLSIGEVKGKKFNL